MTAFERAHKNIVRWREDPLSFVVEELKAEPDPWQVDALRAFPHNQRMAFKACKGPGKTGLLAWFAWNFLATRPHPKIAATSISGDNLADGLWAEMSKWQGRSEFLKTAFEWKKTRIESRDHPETWFMSARTWAKGGDKTQQANTLAGLHADYIMFLLDESGGIPEAVMAAAEAALANDMGKPGLEAKIIQAGNPTHRDGPLFRACERERELWHVTEITGDPDDPKRSPRVSEKWARDQIAKYGRDNPWVMVNVFGKFPPSSINSLLGPDEVSKAMNTRPPYDSYAYAQKRLGVDVARFGDDRTIIFPRQGLMTFRSVEMRGARTPDIAARVAQAKVKWGSEMEMVDGTGGYGAGVIDSLMQAGYSPLEVQFSGAPIDPRYLNKRAEMWFLMAEWVKRGGSLVNDPELLKELTAPTYTFMNGKFHLEPKDQIKERLGFSPDKADALGLTFALPEMPGTQAMPGVFAQSGKLQADYDPFEASRL